MGRTVPSLGLIYNPMNLHEGTRRLALLLGVAGVIVGGFASYDYLQTSLNQRARHNKFEQLATSDVVQNERKILQAWTPVPETPPKIDPQTGELIQPPNGNLLIDPKTGQPVVFDMSTSIPIPSVVMKGGIKAINWSHNYGVESIETEDGQIIIPTPAPAIWEYLLVALFPLLGFFIPWGVILAIGWVVAGFARP